MQQRVSYQPPVFDQLLQLFLPTVLRTLASGASVVPSRLMCMGAMTGHAGLLEVLLSGAGVRATVKRLAESAYGPAAPGEDGTEFEQALSAFGGMWRMPSHAAQRHMVMALYRFKRALSKRDAALMARLEGPVMVRGVGVRARLDRGVRGGMRRRGSW